MLPLLRPILRRPPHLTIKPSHPVLPLRLQHNGPHKEYFQNPSQFPSHAYDVKVPPPNQRARKGQHQPSFDPPSSTLPPPKRISLLRRLLRSALVVGVSITIGWSVGTAVITWDYLQPPFEPGSEQAQDLIEEIDEMLETCTLVQDLRAAGFQEDQAPLSSNSGHHLVNGTLNDVQGFKRRFFRHPQRTELSVMVFFAGFGVEGWPDTVHGGAITSIMTEAAEQHFAPAFESGDVEAVPSGQWLSMSFKVPVRPAEIYAVVVHEQGCSVRARESTLWSAPHEVPAVDIDDQVNAYAVMTYLLSSETFPPEMVDGIRQQQIAEGGADIEGPGPGLKLAVLPTMDYLSILALPESGTLHADAYINVMSRSKHVVREPGETVESYSHRLGLEAVRLTMERHPNIDQDSVESK